MGDSWSYASRTSHNYCMSECNLRLPQSNKDGYMLQALLTEKQAASFLCINFETLRKARYNKSGPDYVQVGRSIRYSVDALSRYISENTIKGR